MLRLRQINPDDYVVFGDGPLIGRIRLARERAPAIWLWTVTVTLPGTPFGEATSLDEAQDKFKAAWDVFIAQHTPDELAKAFYEMNFANRPGRHRR